MDLKEIGISTRNLVDYGKEKPVGKTPLEMPRRRWEGNIGIGNK